MKFYAVFSQAVLAICSMPVYGNIDEGLLMKAYTIAWMTHSNSTLLTIIHIKYKTYLKMSWIQIAE